MESLRLRRTNLFYPTSRDIPDLRGLLGQLNSARVAMNADILEDILEIEEQRFDAGQQGCNGEEFEALIDTAKRAKVLPVDRQRRLYFHILRQWSVPKKLGQAELPLLLDAYSDVIASAHRGYPVIRLQRMHGLLHFGYAPGFDLDRAAPPDLEEFKRRRALWHAFNFQHLPGMLAKLAKFVPFSHEPATVTRLHALVGLVRFRTSDYDGKTYSVFDFALWGMMTIVLLDTARRESLLDAFALEREHLPHFAEHVDVLKRIAAALGEPGVSDSVAHRFGG